MRHGILSSLGTLLAGAGLAVAQQQPPATPTPAAPPAAKATATDNAAPVVVDAPASTLPGHVIPILADGPGSTPYQKPYEGEVDNERDFDVWVGAEYLWWKLKKSPIDVPLITTGPAGSFGILGSGGTTLFGNTELDLDTLKGGRFTAGVGVPGLGVGVESTTFVLEKGNTRFTVSSDPTGNPTLARPVIDTIRGVETSSLIAAPGAFSGSAAVTTESRLWGTEVNLVRGRVSSKAFFGDWILGFRYMDLQESLAISQRSTLLPGGTAGFNGDIVAPGSVVTINDSFKTRNEFYGGQVGMQGEVRLAGFFVYAMGKIALGNVHQTLDIAGSSTQTPPGGVTQAVTGGLLALSSNNGLHSRNAFTYIPEVNVNVGYQFGKHVRVYAGYTFIYWDEVARPGGQPDRNTNPALIPTSLSFGGFGGAQLPAATIRSTDFWVQGVNAGLILRY